MAVVERKLVSGKSSWHVVVSVGGRKVWTKANGQKHARELNSELLVKARNHQLATMRDITFAVLAERYFEHGTSNLREQTIRAYRSRAKNHLLPYFSALKVRKGITVERLNAWVSWERNREVSASAIRGAFTCLSAMLSYAVDIGLLTSNPSRGRRVRLPRVELGGVDATLSPAQVALVIRNTPKQDRALMAFLFLIGCRGSEAAEIRYRDLNWNASSVTISRTAVSTPNRVNGTKTGKVRTVPMAPSLVDLLVEQRVANYDGEDSLVFPTPRGGRRNMSRFARDVLRPALVRSGLNSQIPMSSRKNYLTRKTYCSILLEQGVPVTTVAEWSGNSPAVLAKHYARTRREQGAAAMLVLEASLLGATDGGQTLRVVGEG